MVSIGVLVERRYMSQPQPARLIAALQARGQPVRVLDAQTVSCAMGDDAWLHGLDLIVARGRSLDLFCQLAWAEAHGVPTINTRNSIAAVYNKAEMAVALTGGAVPTPRTFLGNVEHLANQVPPDCYPLIFKPVFGDNGRGLRLAQCPTEVAQLEWQEPIALAQHYLLNDGYDVKLYVIGEEVWAVRKPSPFVWPYATGGSTGRAAQIDRLAVTPAMRDLARRCGEIFDLDLYGVDCIQTANGFVVIEVNDFPNYSGLPEADEILADYVIARARHFGGEKTT